MVSLPFTAPASPPETGASIKFKPRLLRRRRQFAGDRGGSGRMIHEHRTLFHRCKGTIFFQSDLAQIGVAADTGKYDLGIGRGLGGRRRERAGIFLGPFAGARFGTVEHGNGMAGALEVTRHRVSHHTQSDKSQFHSPAACNGLVVSMISLVFMCTKASISVSCTLSSRPSVT